MSKKVVHYFSNVSLNQIEKTSLEIYIKNKLFIDEYEIVQDELTASDSIPFVATENDILVFFSEDEAMRFKYRGEGLYAKCIIVPLSITRNTNVGVTRKPLSSRKWIVTDWINYNELGR